MIALTIVPAVKLRHVTPASAGAAAGIATVAAILPGWPGQAQAAGDAGRRQSAPGLRDRLWRGASGYVHSRQNIRVALGHRNMARPSGGKLGLMLLQRLPASLYLRHARCGVTRQMRVGSMAADRGSLAPRSLLGNMCDVPLFRGCHAEYAENTCCMPAAWYGRAVGRSARHPIRGRARLRKSTDQSADLREGSRSR